MGGDCGFVCCRVAVGIRVRSDILASIVSLACLTTAVGLTSACADFFHSLLPRLSYRTLVIAMSVLCALICQCRLSRRQSALSIPVLVAIYPICGCFGSDDSSQGSLYSSSLGFPFRNVDCIAIWIFGWVESHWG